MSWWLAALLGVLAILMVLRDAITANRREPPHPGTLADPRCHAMAERQKAYGALLRKEGRSMLDKPYKPSVNYIAPEKKPERRVVPMRRVR